MTRLLRLLTPFTVFLLLLFAAAGTAAAAEGEAPPAGEPAAGEPFPEAMSVEFPRAHATLVGPRALVSVKCSGEVAEMCEGTLVLNAGGPHKIPYAIEQGEQQTLAVPLGDKPVDHGCKTRVVARTLQLTGGLVRTSRVMRLG